MPPSAPSQSSSLDTARRGGIVAEDDGEKKETEVQQQQQVNEQNNSALMSASLYNNSGFMSPYGGGMYGGMSAGMYGGGGMYGAGGMGGMYGGTMAGLGGPMSGLNQFLFGFQNVIFSLSQAVQIIGMNTEAVQQLLESATAMFDHAVMRWRELRALEAAHRHIESPEARKRRRRLRALRWAFVAGVTYAGYAFVRKLLHWSSGWSRQRRQLLAEAPPRPTAPSPAYGSTSSYYPSTGVSSTSPYGFSGYGYS